MNIFTMKLITSACENITVLKVCLFIKTLIDICFFLIPIILIVMASIDLFKSVISNEDEMKKNNSLILKRFIYAIAIFLVKTIVSFSINGLGNFNVNYAKCLTVTKTQITKQIETNKKKCTAEEGYEWDDNSDECVITSVND